MILRRVISGSIYVLSAAIGALAFLYPFLLPTLSPGLTAVPSSIGAAHSQDASVVTVVLVALSLIALLTEVQGQAISAKTVAMLGVLVAITSVLRFAEVIIPVAGGFSPIFAPIIIVGYVFGGRFGFLMGTFTLLVSALITGGVGPWLPYQMYAAGWVGMSAGWLRRIVRSSEGRPSVAGNRWEVLLLCAAGFVWGLLFGAIMNIFFWPLAAGPADQTWSPGTGLMETVSHYAVFYIATSLGWDLARALGNAALILLLGAPVVRALTRFRRRFQFEVNAHA